MTAHQIIFYILSAAILGFGLLSVTTRKIFRSAIWLLFSLISVAALYFWMELEFIAAVQIVVYVGGIVVLILFSVFLTQQSGMQMSGPPLPRMIAGLGAAVLGFCLAVLLIYQQGFTPAGQPFQWSMEQIGTQMMDTKTVGFALPFEVISMLLLAAMIGCIVIAIKPKPSGQ